MKIYYDSFEYAFYFVIPHFVIESKVILFSKISTILSKNVYVNCKPWNHYGN